MNRIRCAEFGSSHLALSSVGAPSSLLSRVRFTTKNHARHLELTVCYVCFWTSKPCALPPRLAAPQPPAWLAPASQLPPGPAFESGGACGCPLSRVERLLQAHQQVLSDSSPS
mmetsp:Transcript_19498/g.30516  ORF Transcript_19498/g.30516 Transcript_19498/m.30516 type:complete len:113 (-) Transcript_19498:595-933(-)